MSKSTPPRNSRIPKFFQLDVQERIDALRDHGFLSDTDTQFLQSGAHTLKPHVADQMIENVVGVIGLPIGVGLNFLINGIDYIVPLAVEEPSIVAGLSGAARTARASGGYTVSTTDPILIGQVQIVNLECPHAGKTELLRQRESILNLANSLHPKMVARGGGAKDIEAHVHDAGEGKGEMLVLHLLVDTRDAMGANVVNSMCEGVSTLVESITGGKVFLRILSNLTDRSVVTAQVRIPEANLSVRGYSGTEVRDGIVLANDLARVDPYRAATHNKGIMNGVDAVAIATGNDFRAIEAAAHAYAARDGQYRALTRWECDDRGDLLGTIEMPMKVGTVGGSLETNPTVRICHRLLGSPDAQTLAGIMGAVGLAQNYAALRALASAGIQQNHMTLHARSVASSADVPDEYFDAVVEALIEDGNIKVWRAKELLTQLETHNVTSIDSTPRSKAFGKVILLGEHAVVWGRPALAAPLPLAVEARVVKADTTTLLIPRWGVEQRIPPTAEHPQGLAGILAHLLEDLNLSSHPIAIEAFPNVPRAVGLGGSSALAVAVIRALSDYFGLELSDEEVNDYAFECEQAAHGTPSGVDNTIATWGEPLLFKRNSPGEKAQHEVIHPRQPTPIVVGISRKESLTANMIAQVRSSRERQPSFYESMFSQIEELTVAGADAFRNSNFAELGELMNICHGYLNAMRLSTPELEDMVHIARRNGASGAKLTGGGGGGSILALCPDGCDEVVSGLDVAGYRTLAFNIE